MVIKPHDHEWVYSHRTCCHVLRCDIAGCERKTTATVIKGKTPKNGDKVRILSDGHTIELIR